MTSRWQPMNTISNTHNSFSSNIYSNASQSRSKSQRHGSNNYSGSYPNNNQTTQRDMNNGFNLNRNSINNNNLNSNIIPHPISRQNGNYLTQCFSLFQSYIIRLFSSYPTWIQAIITAIIGFIAYFLFDFAEGSQSVKSFVFYKLLSFIGFIISISFLYLSYYNIFQNNKQAQLRPTIPTSLNPNNPYYPTINNTLRPRPSQRHQPQQDHNIKSDQYGGPKRDELYFTKKKMNRVSSSTYNVDRKYDYNSSPTKIASYDPNQIVTQKGLNKFLDKQSKQKRQSQMAAASALLTTPMASSVINNNIKTPIGKAFGSMRMTPGNPVSQHRSHSFDTPKGNGMYNTHITHPCTQCILSHFIHTIPI